MTQPLISIITPVKNGEAHIDACINNVISQQSSKVEHIIVDGGSTDKTLLLIRDWEEKCTHLRLIHKPDDSQSLAINRGIAMSKGSILGILNVDDFYEQNTFSRIESIFSHLKDPAFCVANYNIIDEKNNLIKTNKPSCLKFDKLVQGNPRYVHPTNPTAYFYHKSIHDIVGLYNEDLHYNMDLDFILRVAKDVKMHYFDETWGNFRFMPGTKTFQSLQTNSAYQVDKKVLAKYWPHLPLIQRICYPIQYELLRNPAIRRSRILAKLRNINSVT